MVSRAIDLNEQLQKVLTRHEALLSGRSIPTANRPTPTANRPTPTANHFNHEDPYLSARSTSTANHVNHEEEEEEEAEQLFRRFVYLH